MLGLLSIGFGCDATLDTGTAKRPVNNKPAADGSCPSGQSKCGSGTFAICVDLQTDPSHCGDCARACTPGIACQAGVCQQTLCTEPTLPFVGQPATTASVGQAPYGMTFGLQEILADVNGDGLLDRIEWVTFGSVCQTCNLNLGEFRVSLALPGGTFAPPDAYQASADVRRILATDVNGDGLSDLYVISSTFANSAVAPFHVDLWLGQPDGHLQRSPAAGLSADGEDGYSPETTVSDFSGDGWPDLVMEAPDPNPDDPPRINVYLSDSTGALHLAQTIDAWFGNAFVRDWNRDGSPDLVLLYEGMQILYNRGDGTFAAPVDCALWVGGVANDSLLVEDFNRDGFMDIAAAGLGDKVEVMLGLGGCGFTPIAFFGVPGFTSGLLRAADMNGDGILDLLTVNPVIGPDPRDATGMAKVTTDNLLAVLLGKGDGTFTLQDPVISLGPDVTDITVGEVTGDQRPDVLVAGVDGGTSQVSTMASTCQ